MVYKRLTCPVVSLPNPAMGNREMRMKGKSIAIAVAAILAFSGGCATDKVLKSDSNNQPPPGVASGPFSSQTRSESGQIVQASASIPAASSTNSSFSWFTGKDKSKSQVNEIAIGWRNWIDHLPDPTRDGASGPGLAGQMFLFGPGLQSVDADGSLIVELFDETPRPPGQPGNAPERWTFDKDTLNKKLRSVDERFGKCFVLFLPWPTYRPDVTKVRIVSRYQADGKTLMPEETKLTIGLNPNNTYSSLSNDSMFGPGVQSLGAMSLLGTQSSGGFSPAGMNAGAMPLGVIGSLPSGATTANMPVSNLPATSSAMPITGATMTNMPLSSMQGSAQMPMNPSGAYQAPSGAMAPPSPGYGGLNPVGSTPQGLPPMAFTVNPLGK